MELELTSTGNNPTPHTIFSILKDSYDRWSPNSGLNRHCIEMAHTGLKGMITVCIYQKAESKGRGHGVNGIE